MTITEAQRSAMYESMKAVHGSEVAETIMSIYPPGDGDRIATTRDLDDLRAATRADMAELRTEMATMKSELRADMAELRAGMATMKSELLRTFGGWLFASQAGVVAAVALIVSLAR